ncbi:hypothetical protein RRG08_040188 [Elysia crispata]|uniref:Uncharacterized protein n=1 Tax=Elysia crispata TaxID=231223 RepID=A0AAE0XW74_9GAST|nr:hypothetical protein RRG08_040188 [Elysia crispata]
MTATSVCHKDEVHQRINDQGHHECQVLRAEEEATESANAWNNNVLKSQIMHSLFPLTGLISAIYPNISEQRRWLITCEAFFHSP